MWRLSSIWNRFANGLAFSFVSHSSAVVSHLSSRFFTRLDSSLICLHSSVTRLSLVFTRLSLVFTRLSFVCTRLSLVFTRLHSPLIRLHSSRHSPVILAITLFDCRSHENPPTLSRYKASIVAMTNFFLTVSIKYIYFSKSVVTWINMLLLSE